MGKALVVDSANQGSIARGEPTTIVVAGGVPYFVDSSNNITAIAKASDLVGLVSTGAPDITLSGLTTDGSPDFNADYVRTYDASASGRKKVVLKDVSGWVSAGSTELSGGTTVLLASSLPPNIREFLLVFHDLSLNSLGSAVVQLGISSGIVTAGYVALSTNGAGTDTTFTNGFGVSPAFAIDVMFGEMRIYRHSGNKWACTHNVGRSTSSDTMIGAGKISLSEELTAIYVVANAGAFDNGSISVFYRF